MKFNSFNDLSPNLLKEEPQESWNESTQEKTPDNLFDTLNNSRNRTRNRTISLLKEFGFLDEEIQKLQKYAWEHSDKFLEEINNILKMNSEVCKIINANSVSYKVRNKIVYNINEIEIDNLEAAKEQSDKDCLVLKEIIFEAIKIFKEYNEYYFLKYVQHKFDLMKYWEFSSEEINTMLSKIKEYKPDMSVSETFAFMKRAIQHLKGEEQYNKIEKEYILKGIDRINADMIANETERQKRRTNRTYTWIDIFFDMVDNKISSREQRIIRQWISKEDLETRLQFANAKKKAFYLLEIKQILKGNRWKIDIDTKDIHEAIDFLWKISHKYSRHTAISSLNPTCVFNYIIVNKNRDTISPKASTYINNRKKTAKELFPDIEFFWTEEDKSWKAIKEDKIRELIQIVYREKWRSSTNTTTNTNTPRYKKKDTTRIPKHNDEEDITRHKGGWAWGTIEEQLKRLWLA